MKEWRCLEKRRSLAAAIHLQWFADDNEADGRTEEPTEHKIQRLREEGQVVKSQELVGALTLLLPALLLLFLAPSMLRTCVEMVRFFFLRVVELDPTRDGIVAAAFFNYLARLALPILAVAVFSALFSNLVQTGFIFTTKPLVPDMTRVLPRVGQFFRRTLFSVDGLFNFFKSIGKMAIIGLVAFFLIRADIEKLINLQKADLWLSLTTVASLAIRMLIISALLMLIISIPDYMFQRWRFRERNKMSRQELKEEMRMYEADPQIQSRIRGRFRDLLRQNIAAAVPRADVVITNPTHLAVALEYRPSMRGPMLTAMGADEMAARIRRLADENGVPIVEDKPLAWALYRETNVGDIIPDVYFTAVATIFKKVMSINDVRRKARSA
ncbi:MAG: EscU/YscU/HrcU family type III secretion system export apparatus switch protein [Treponema sp.]|nr:EscU/YscU/HrcU family type III secretion system export apparatus switch protein [Treponema sp.]